MNRRAWPPAQRAFTLIELMLGLALLGMTLAIAFAGLSFAGRSLEHTDALVHEVEEFRVAGNVVQTLLGQALPLAGNAQQKQVLFHGEAQTVEFVAPAPSQQGRLVGIYHYRLHFVPDRNGVRLVLDHQPYIPEVRVDWSDEHATTDLAQGLVGGTFSYFGKAQTQHPEDWVEQWNEAATLPTLLRMQIQRAPGASAWPDRVVQLHAGRAR